jgi:circadian clock protein KaiC
MSPKLKDDKILSDTVLKIPSGITGLDQITMGGFPKGRPVLICGGPGCGKTLMSMEFIVRGAALYNEPGVFVSFEEKSEELKTNVRSLGFDLANFEKNKMVKLDHVYIERSEIEETGEYDLDGLFIRLGHSIDSIGAKRVVLDTIENLFAGLDNEGIIRAELRRLFLWLKDKGVTAIITGEKGDGSFTRQGLEEYVSDCVILLEHRVSNHITTRFLRVLKYRGSLHGTNEYPFLIDEDGISVLPVTSLELINEVTTKRVKTGIPSLDVMLGGKGFFRGSSILISGTAGTGKTSIAAVFANETCNRGERCIYFAFEESPQQIVRNMKSIGVNLQKHIDDGNLQMHSARPTLYGLEMHLVYIHKAIKKMKPATVILDPISNFVSIGMINEVKTMLIRLIDFLQTEHITVIFTSLTLNSAVNEQTDEGISSLVDAWIQIRHIEVNGERNKGLYIMKSRGMEHSNQVREFVIRDSGLNLVDVFLGPTGVLTGAAREEQELQEQTSQVLRDYAFNRKDREIERKKLVLESKIATLKEEFESLREELNNAYIEEDLKKEVMGKNREKLIRNRINKKGNGKTN